MPSRESFLVRRRAVHLTSVHRRSDPRILLKQCRSLAAAGWLVTLVVADGLGNSNVNEVEIIDIGHSTNRTTRLLKLPVLMYRKAIELNADVYHLHDPELLTVGLWLKRQGRRVIFDSHEDVPSHIRTKGYLPTWLRGPLSTGYALFEKLALRRFDAVITSTPHIRDRLAAMNPLVVDIKNYPIAEELFNNDFESERANEVCYVGGISLLRGLRQMVEAVSLLEGRVRLQLGGVYMAGTSPADVSDLRGWQWVDDLGFLSREQVRQTLSRAIAGIVTLQPDPTFVVSLPNKLFEYMSAGLPVIASDFPLWRAIIDQSGCGICVDSTDSRAISDAIATLVEDPELARQMGINGRAAVEQHYNWEAESLRLAELYAGLVA